MRNTRTMARRRSRALAEGFLDFVALVPWWASVLLAILSYIVAQHIGASLLGALSRPGVSAFALATFAAASVAQYALPALLIALAAVSALRRSKLQKIGLSGAPLRNKARGAPLEQRDTTTPQAALCPDCNAPMARRIARRTNASGSYFWGCTRFPDCRGTRPYP